MHMFRRRPRPSTLIATAAVVLATGGTALAATDAVPGDPFRLGEANTISTAPTALLGTDQTGPAVFEVRKQSGGVGAAARIENAAAGISQPGLVIRTRPGQAPIQVNGDAGKATGLNADKLDGLSASDFLQPRIYSDGSATLVGPGGGETFGLNALNANLRCDAGDIAISAGANALDDDDDLNAITPFKGSYQIQFQDNGPPGQFRANIICLDAVQPFRG